MKCGCDKVPNTTLHPIAFTSKSLSSIECYHSNIEYEALGILYVLEKFHPYCFVKEVCIITGHQQSVAILSKDVVILSQ